MSEEQAKYQTEVEEVLEMLGVGYGEEPAVIIEKPRKDLALHEDGLREYKVWGWVKKSAKFIFHVKKLRGAKLSIWEVISLSIDEDGECNMSLNDLVKLTGYSRSEVSESVAELEKMGYLSVKKEAGKKSIYSPSFAARGENIPSDEPIQKVDGSTRPVSKDGYPSSFSNINSSPSFNRVKRVNTPNGDAVDFELSKLPAISIRKAVSECFKLNTNWETKYNRQWMEWAVETGITAEQIAQAADTWRTDKQFNWQVPTLKGIFEKWQLLMEAVAPPKQTPNEGKGFYG